MLAWLRRFPWWTPLLGIRDQGSVFRDRKRLCSPTLAARTKSRRGWGTRLLLSGCSLGRAGYAIHVFAEDAPGPAQCGRRKAIEPRRDFFVANFKRQLAVGNIEVDDIALAYGGDGSAGEGFGSDVAGGKAAGCATEPAVGEQSHRG